MSNPHLAAVRSLGRGRVLGIDEAQWGGGAVVEQQQQVSIQQPGESSTGAGFKGAWWPNDNYANFGTQGPKGGEGGWLLWKPCLLFLEPLQYKT